MEFDATDHWECLFNKSYLRWFHLQGQPALCEVVKVEKDVELTMKGGAKAKKPVVTLKQLNGKIDGPMKLVLNTTNANSIAEICGPKPSKWPGQKIVLHTATASLQGKTVPCIHIRAPKN